MEKLRFENDGSVTPSAEEIDEHLRRGDGLDIMVDHTEAYWKRADAYAAEIGESKFMKDAARIEREQREAFNRTVLGRLLHKIF